MPCNCLKCDCCDVRNNMIIANRLNGLAAMLDAAAAGDLASDTTVAAISLPASVCGATSALFAGLFTGTYASANILTNTVLSGAAAGTADATGSLSYGACAPTLAGACVACSGVSASVTPLCAAAPATADNYITEYPKHAQNLRLLAQIVCCT